MSVAVDVEGNVVVAHIDGRLDSGSAAQLEEAVLSRLSDGITTVTVDMEKLEFVSSKGLRILISILKALPSGDVRLRKPNSFVMDVLKVTGLVPLFRIEQ